MSNPLRTWRVTWIEGRAELVRAHSLQHDLGARLIYFNFDYIGAIRIINMAFVREIERVDDPR